MNEKPNTSAVIQALGAATTVEEIEAAIRNGLRALDSTALAELDTLVATYTDPICAMYANAEHASDDRQAAIAAGVIVCAAVRLLTFAQKTA